MNTEETNHKEANEADLTHESVEVDQLQASDEAQDSAEDKASEEQSEATDTSVEDLATSVKNLEDKLLRAVAENQNLSRRHFQEIEKIHKYASEPVIKELLPVFDSFESLLNLDESLKEKMGDLYSGVELLYKQLLDVLKKNGVEELNPAGADFDPSYHQAMKTEESTEIPPEKVVQVFQKGYLLKDRLIRPALVTVSKKPQQ